MFKQIINTLFFLIAVLGVQTVFAQFDNVPLDDMPPQPSEFGKCYAKCRVADCEVELFKTVMTKDETQKFTTVPAQYETVSEQVLIKEASVKLVPVPAEYETITEKVLVKEAATKIVTKPPVYKTETERVMVSAAYGEWVRKKRAPNCFSQNPVDCHVMCWVEVPAKYKNITKKVLVEPGREEVVEIPAEYKTVTRRVLKTPATVKEVEIPAEYKTFTRRVQSIPARTESETIPAEYETVTYKMIADYGGFSDWVEVLCDNQQTSSVVSRVQQSLADKGYNPGPVDGIMGGQTKTALEKYQKENNLPIGNLNTETLSALGVSY